MFWSTLRCCSVLLACAVVTSSTLPASVADDQTAKAGEPDLKGFRTVENAITTRISKSIPTEKKSTQPAFLGLHAEMKEGRLIVADVAAASPAANAGVRIGDVLVMIGKSKNVTADVLRDVVHGKSPGAKLALTVLREKKREQLEVTLGATSRPFSLTSRGGRGRGRGYMGITMEEIAKKRGVRIATVRAGGPSEKGGLKPGDILLKFDGKAVNSQTELLNLLARTRVGQRVTLDLTRDKKDIQIKMKLGSTQPITGRGGNFDFRRSRRAWAKPVYRLAVIPVEFADVKQNKKISVKDWQTSLFSRGKYNTKSVTGQTVYGSLNDYYLEQSFGKFHVEGKVFDYVQVSKKRDSYGQGSKSRFFNEALDQLLKRDGRDALKNYDGLFFLYAGKRGRSARGGLFWPHRASHSYKGKRWSYFICPEGGSRMDSISVIAHEFGHMLGLPDLYPQAGRNPEGLGIWCTMSVGHGRTGKPLHFSAWCKEQLGWIQPAVVDPRTKQKLILSPVMTSPKQCVKVLIHADGSEYFLLENRIKKGFERDLPGEGLLVWRVSGGRPVLLESHGITNTQGPRVFLGSVPYPSKANNALTPFTTPSSQGSSGGGLPVYITNIRRLADGRVTFYIGYEFY